MQRQRRMRGREEQRVISPDLMATNTGVRLACTMAAMIGLFGLFLAFVEKESRVIRRFAVQSAALTAVHAGAAALLLTLGWCLGAIPYFGFMVTLVCWLCYVALLLALIAQRVRLMERAWNGMRCELPILEPICARYYDTDHDGTEEN